MNKQNIIDVANDYFYEDYEEYIDEQRWAQAIKQAEYAILSVIDVLDKDPTNRLSEESLDELFQRFCIDYYFEKDMYDEENIV